MFIETRYARKKYMQRIKVPASLYFVLLGGVFFLLGIAFEKSPDALERFYSLGINKWTIQGLSLLTGIFPFSLGEIIYVSHLIAIPFVLFLLIYRIFKGGFFDLLGRIIIYISLAYILFMGLWGFNYSRMPVSEMINLEVSISSKEELYNLNLILVEQANKLRTKVEEDEENIMTIKGGYRDVFSRADKGFHALSGEIRVLSGKYGRPKPIALSRLMLHTRITGMYFPFTGEANVNVAIPYLLLPATTLHEMAHQRGIAPEDEANYIAYITGINHPDYDFQYSSTVLALFHSMNALSREDLDLAREVANLYSEDLRRDIVSYREFWRRYEGRTSEVAERVNDGYLRSNRQDDGVKSYGRMVDLLLAHYKAENRI